MTAGEAQRLRLAVQTSTGLTGIMCLFDEPSAGLHPRDTLKLISILKKLRDKGNTVIVIEHEEEFIRHADWLIDIGPGAGAYGGELVYSGPVSGIADLPAENISKSRTISFLLGKEKIEVPERLNITDQWLTVEGAAANNLRNIDVKFRLGALNVITGVSGAGKSSLAEEVIGKALRRQIKHSSDIPGQHTMITGSEKLSDVISIDQSPIGRTPRSNPATYTGLSDLLRDLFASLPEAINRGLTKSHFSFNTEGGRCENCQGAGFIQTGMHFMGNVEIQCEVCEGKRFRDEILEVHWKGKNMHDILDMFISEALEFFKEQPKIFSFLKVMDDLGLGYLKPGQRSTTLSGGEAQRIKLATELARPVSKPVLYILDEPTNGLHQADVSRLLAALSGLTHHGHTVIIIEHHTGIIAAADHIVDLGPGSGKEGGTVVVTGTPSEVSEHQGSFTGKALKEYLSRTFEIPALPEQRKDLSNEIILNGVSTNNLKDIDVTIPKGKMTVITGVSGSGKSSLAFDTLFAEGKNRFMESFSAYIRARTGMEKGAEAAEITGLTPPLAIDQHNRHATARSTAGTMTGIYDFYRLLYARVASDNSVISSLFSFNHHHGACEKCDGLGHLTICDPGKLITDPQKSILAGAMDGTRTGKFYGEPDGQYIATIKAAGKAHGIDYTVSWNELSEKGKDLALYGTGDELYDITWEYRRGERTGEHHFKGRWQGLLDLVNEEYIRKHADHRGEEMLHLMKEVTCAACKGQRLNEEALSYKIGGMNISELSELSVRTAIEIFSQLEDHLADPHKMKVAEGLRSEILRKLKILEDLGLPYLQVSREISTLSGGEFQRLKLASLLGSGLTGVTYIPDEPTLGLHPSDTAKLINKLKALTEAGNTLVVVEHDRDVILSADHIIEMGPGAGANGGRIIASGSPEEIMRDPNSVTGPYLNKTSAVKENKKIPDSPPILIKGAFANNLKNIDVSIPSGGITVVAGVSGAGKSTLVFDVLYGSWIKNTPTGCREISGFENFANVVEVRQRPSFSAVSATPVTYTGIFEKIRDLFASTPDARERGLSKNHFSFNRKEGRCPECEGTGVKKISMDFLPDIESICETCGGKRYRDEILQCRYNGKTIYEVLSMTLSEMKAFFSGQKSMKHTFDLLEKTGLGYLTGDQSLDTLSGGESRRLVLANGLIRPARGKTLYLFEEPTSGLHFRDTEYLLILFDELATQGHALVIIEHDPMIIAHADHLITLGPDGDLKT